MATYRIKAEQMVTGGDCISSIDGKKIFVPLAIPGEELEVEITKEFRDYSVGKIVSVLTPSPHRVQPFCPLYGKCGGCNMMHIDSSQQQELRKSILKEAFMREGIEPPEIEVVAGSDRSYRARFQLHDGGLMERASNKIIQLDGCKCATAEVNRYLSEIAPQDRPKGRVHLFGSSSITSIPSDYDKIVIACEEERQRKKEERILKGQPRKTVNGRPMKKQKKIKPRFEGTTFNPANSCTIDLLGKNISFDVQGFFQSNLELLGKAIPLITEGLSGNNALDIYAGVGTFSIFLANSFKHVCLVEHNRDALAYAEMNLSGKSHESYGVSAENWIKNHSGQFTSLHGSFDAAVVDPPRSGMEKSVRNWLSSSQIPRIHSLSCDAATQARDVASLLKGGYRLDRLFLLDFYPQTCHIESLAWLSL
ncbi:MAG: class I SAM-dependent RNA methyltransferase [Treponema sp.]|nr:class I SAM-dependent RNA methyltransferase [Treponema sp.]